MLKCTPESVLAGSDALIISTEWQQFKAPDFDLIEQRLKAPVIFDGRNLYEPSVVASHGLDYYAIGRQPRSAARAGS
jgi:UDPglucose 6-dehydrogenase